MKPLKANELRIRNIVQDGNGFVIRAVSIHDDGTIYCDFDGNEGDVWEFDDKNPCYGVELTEEILLERGFEKIKEDVLNCNVDYVNNKYNYYWIQHHTEVNDFVFFGEQNTLGISVKYLHRLQNLFFALTGEELTKK